MPRFALSALPLISLLGSTAHAEIQLSDWIGRWHGPATIFGLPFFKPVLTCDMNAEFHWIDDAHTAVEGVPVYACDGITLAPWHRFQKTAQGTIELFVNWGLGNIRFSSEAQGPWMSFFWDRSPLRPFQFLQGLYIQQMTVTQFHTPGHIEKTITVKEPGRQPRYLLTGSFTKVQE